MSREYTTEEVRNRFTDHIRAMVEYWATLDMPEREKLNGLAFSILVALDGEATAVPAFIVAPYPHPDDKHYHVENGEHYYPENHDSQVRCDISGALHESFSRRTWP